MVILAAFNPSASSNDAHHMLLYGCAEPGRDKKIWLDLEQLLNIEY